MKNPFTKIAGLSVLLLVCNASSASAQQDSSPEQVSQKTQICLAPATAQVAAGNPQEASEAVRETFASYLTGPSLNVTPLTARLAAQVREEARQGGCTYVLFASMIHKRKEGGGLFSKMAGEAGQAAAWRIPGGRSTASSAARAAAVTAASAALRLAGNTKAKDELKLEYRLEAIDQPTPLVDKAEKAKAKADGEDLLTPLVEKAANDIVEAVRPVAAAQTVRPTTPAIRPAGSQQAASAIESEINPAPAIELAEQPTGVAVPALEAEAEGTPGASDGHAIPLCEGLTIVTALNEARGDYESIKQVIHADAKNIKLAYSVDLPASADDNPLAALLGGANQPKQAQSGDNQRHEGGRKIRREDLETAHDYRIWFRTGVGEEFYPGSTAVGVSSSVLGELKTQGRTKLRVSAMGLEAGLAGLLGGLLGDDAKELDGGGMAEGMLTVADPKPVSFKVLVNDEPVELPTVHARGTLGDNDAEFWILDDPANPLALRYRVGDIQLQVIKLTYPVRQAPASPGPPVMSSSGSKAGSGAPAASTTAERIEQDLAKEGRTVVYGIYFDFASDRIKKESEPVLAEIAAVLQQNPTWALSVEGHTDNIGGDAYNLDLSKRRAAAVKEALVSRHKIDGKRLQTGGYGASVPKDTNDTLEGRARNRRVELAKVG